MPNSFDHFSQVDPSNAQAGEIWQVLRSIKSPLQKSQLFSKIAQQFLTGQLEDRYVMIVRTPELFSGSEWQEITVMVLSCETASVSQVDVLIPASTSGLEHDILAETWHVVPMLHCNLLRPVGNRLSRAVYDRLLDIGDADHSLVKWTDSSETAGLTLSWRSPSPTFHQQERDWSEVLTAPVMDYRAYIAAETAIDKTLDVERALFQLTTTPITSARISLKRWFDGQMQANWVPIENLLNTEVLYLSNQGIRATNDSQNSSNEIAAIVAQLSQETDVIQQRSLIRQLASIAEGNATAIDQILSILRSTTDDETLWTAVECLWEIDPGNPAEGVRRVKLINLGMQVSRKTVALAIAIVQKPDQRIGVMLRVYPTGGEPYVPEHLKLILIENREQTYEVVARRTDLYVQLKFNAQVGETFSVRVALGETGITENFIV